MLMWPSTRMWPGIPSAPCRNPPVGCWARCAIVAMKNLETWQIPSHQWNHRRHGFDSMSPFPPALWSAQFSGIYTPVVQAIAIQKFHQSGSSENCSQLPSSSPRRGWCSVLIHTPVKATVRIYFDILLFENDVRIYGRETTESLARCRFLEDMCQQSTFVHLQFSSWLAGDSQSIFNLFCGVGPIKSLWPLHQVGAATAALRSMAGGALRHGCGVFVAHRLPSLPCRRVVRRSWGPFEWNTNQSFNIFQFHWHRKIIRIFNSNINQSWFFQRFVSHSLPTCSVRSWDSVDQPLLHRSGGQSLGSSAGHFAHHRIQRVALHCFGPVHHPKGREMFVQMWHDVDVMCTLHPRGNLGWLWQIKHCRIL